MKLDKGICSECEKEGLPGLKLIVNKRHNLCQYHNRVRLDSQRTGEVRPKSKQTPSRFSRTFNYDTRWGFVKEMDMFLEIYNSGPKVSAISGKHINFSPSCFAHILAKGLNKYPHYKLNPENIMLVTMEEHFLIDSSTKEKRDKYELNNPPSNFKKFFDEAERLKKEHNEYYIDDRNL